MNGYAGDGDQAYADEHVSGNYARENECARLQVNHLHDDHGDHHRDGEDGHAGPFHEYGYVDVVHESIAASMQ